MKWKNKSIIIKGVSIGGSISAIFGAILFLINGSYFEFVKGMVVIGSAIVMIILVYVYKIFYESAFDDYKQINKKLLK
jgi:hypothetical protein